MPISEAQLKSILQHHANSGLMSSKGDAYINSMSGGRAATVNESQRELVNPNVNDYDGDGWDSMWLGSTYGNETDYNGYNEISAQNSNLPAAIKNSMLENRIDTGRAGGQSVTDKLNLKPVKQKMQQIAQVTEQKIPQAQQTIDYSLIKSIVKSCLDEYMDSQQGTLKTIGLSSGKIKLVDNKGNIFVATLEHKGNVNDTKKK